MKLTEKFIRENFKAFNKKYFDDNLTEPDFSITMAKLYLGRLAYRRKEDVGCCDFIIAISDYYDRSEHDYLNTLLHEMIHLYIRQNNIEDTRKHHGKIFNEIAQRISGDGWDIGVTANMDNLKPKRPTKCNMVAFVGKKNPCLIRYSTKSKEYFKRVFDKNGISDIVWFESNEYGSFPICRKRFRGLNLTMEEYERIKRINTN